MKRADRVTLGLALLAIAGLTFAAPAAAAPCVVTARLGSPVPAADIGSTQLGADAGVSLTWMEYTYSGVGLDFMYHYWPASTGYRGAFDRWLRANRFEALDGSEWAFPALQFTGHVKGVSSIGEHWTPWVQVGAGAYRVDLNLDEQPSPGTYAWVTGPVMRNVRTVAGGYIGVGLDFRGASHLGLGVDATFHYLLTQDHGISAGADLPDFSALTVGTHVRFGP